MTNKNKEGNKSKENSENKEGKKGNENNEDNKGNENNEDNKGNENNGVITIQEMNEKNLNRVGENKDLDIDSHIADKEGMISGCIIS